MSDCSKHKKEVAGISDMKVLAEMIGDLHYESLAELFKHLAEKVEFDGEKDCLNCREVLGNTLILASAHIYLSYVEMKKAWQISKPFMKDAESI